MSLEDQVRVHEEWLRSIDSNLDRVTAALARMSERPDQQGGRLAAVEDALATVARNQADFAAAMTSLARRVDELTAGVDENRTLHRELAAQHARLEQAFEQYLRSQTNGRQN